MFLALGILIERVSCSISLHQAPFSALESVNLLWFYDDFIHKLARFPME